MSTKYLSIVLTAALFAATASMRAQPTIAAIQGEFQDVQNNLQSAAVDLQTGILLGAQTTTVADINAALSNLTVIADDMTNAAIQTALGKRYKTLEHEVSNHIVQANIKLVTVLVDVNHLVVANGTISENAFEATYQKKKTIITEIQTIARGVLEGELLLGKPPVVVKDSVAAGFYHPGEEASVQIDLSVCDDPTPVITVTNESSLSSPIETNTVAYDSNTGVLKFAMGPDSGGGSITISSCGQTNTLLVYNFGTTPVSGVPVEFPQNLPAGKYLMTYTATGLENVPTVTVGLFQLVSLESFYNNISKAFNAAISSVAEPDCTQSVVYTAFTDATFTVSYTISCGTGAQSASENITFTLTRQ